MCAPCRQISWQKAPGATSLPLAVMAGGPAVMEAASTVLGTAASTVLETAAKQADGDLYASLAF